MRTGERGGGGKGRCHVRRCTVSPSRPPLRKEPQEAQCSLRSPFSWRQCSLRDAGVKGESAPWGRGTEEKLLAQFTPVSCFLWVKVHPLGITPPECMDYVTWLLAGCSGSQAVCLSSCCFLQVQKQRDAPELMRTPAKREKEMVQGISEGTQGLDPNSPAF